MGTPPPSSIAFLRPLRRFGFRTLWGALSRASSLRRFRLEESLRQSGGILSGLPLFLLLGTHGDVLAASNPPCLVGIASNGEVDGYLHLWMQRHRYLVQSDDLDRRMQRDLRPVDREAVFGNQRGKIARRNRPVQLAPFGGLTQDSESLAVEGLGDLLRLAFLLQVPRLELYLHILETRAIFLGRTQRLAFRQE